MQCKLKNWRRTLHYYRHRVFRSKKTTHDIAAGLAIGVSVSFSPLLGTHTLEAVFLAWIFRANKLASFIGTAIGNPFTFPFMFWADYKFGAFLFSLMGMEKLSRLPQHISWHYFLEKPMTLFLPMMLGGTFIGLAVWPLAYALLYLPVFYAKKIYHDRRHRK
jgi:uncharacterized protein (DUF2062 family)